MDRFSKIADSVALGITHEGSERSMTAVARGPYWDSVEADWNTLHDITTQLDEAVREYDIAASYTGQPFEKDAKGMIKAIKDLRKDIDDVAMKKMGKVVDMEIAFVKKHGGTPEEIVDELRRRVFKN